MQLDDLMRFQSNVELQLDDGTLPASSFALYTFSSVFRNAIEAHSAGNASGQQQLNSTDKITIPLPGLSKEQWLRVAAFLYPVVPSPKIVDFDEAEQLLEVGLYCSAIVIELSHGAQHL